ncbi:FHA domain-containing protein [Pyxidicoccus parkwayensis]|uniref:FHA domain-containing protein n=1 Tax=Pyxidicoccus parkwayensis TaxID=2813578 RepID=A0ABX7NZ68_9BACT|nr:FHA domain-containing protein [Pyxidicoccus parkwaysis]QSQ22699.1 FHA domain-containing protein [Pyxidicoccus parkwaysis]
MHRFAQPPSRWRDAPVLHRLSTLASQLLVDREAVLRKLHWPVLVWESVPALSASVTRSDGLTQAGRRPQARVVEPLVFEVRPRPRGGVSEVTVGRGPECDIVLSEPTVSRMHARFRQEPHTGMWSVTDLGSHNGTFQGGVLIVPGRPAPLFARASLRLGCAELVFLQTGAFEQYVHVSSQRTPARLTRGG